MKLLKPAVLAALMLSPFAAAQAQSCVCEHSGSAFDGFCEANPQQEYYYNDPSLPKWRYDWIATGAGGAPGGNDPFSGFGYYHCNEGTSCGMKFKLFYRFPPLAGYVEVYEGEYPCAFGTGGD